MFEIDTCQSSIKVARRCASVKLSAAGATAEPNRAPRAASRRLAGRVRAGLMPAAVRSACVVHVLYEYNSGTQ